MHTHRRAAAPRLYVVALLIALLLPACASAAPDAVSFSAPTSVDCFDVAEVVLKVARPDAANPFTDVKVTAEFASAAADAGPVAVDGFCDAADGSVYRVRFMPTKTGDYRFTVRYEDGAFRREHAGVLTAHASAKSGPVRVDPGHPFHFVVARGDGGADVHWFWNSTTTYQLLAWDDDTIQESVARLSRLGVNRIRVAMAGRTKDGGRWGEPLVRRTDRFAFKVEPWPAARPDDVEDPGYDVTRFNLELFRKADRLLEFARERGVVVSLIFYVDGADKGVDPFGKAGMAGADERRYYRYAIARFAAFANVMWDVTNEYRLFRDDAWAEKMGAFVKECDPYDHLTSVHGHGDFRFRKSPWADFAMYQQWDDSGGYRFMLMNRRDQLAAGRPMPQVNEEYGYEDHYPTGWGGAKPWPARTADTRRRLAWEMTMAGCYQTTGERANGGTGAGPDTGGGWINGRGDEHMTMLLGYQHMASFFTSFEWWKLEPRPDLAGENTRVLAEPGRRYVCYLPAGGTAAVNVLPAGAWRARWFNCRTRAWSDLPDVRQAVEGPYASPSAADAGDWALVLESK